MPEHYRCHMAEFRDKSFFNFTWSEQVTLFNPQKQLISFSLMDIVLASLPEILEHAGPLEALRKVFELRC